MSKAERRSMKGIEAEPGRILAKELFLYFLDLEIKRSRRYQNFLSILIWELDALPDGDGGGDVLTCYQMLANLLMDEMRETDILGSLGGNRLAALLPYADGLAGDHAKKRFESILKCYDFKSNGHEIAIQRICFPTDSADTSDVMKKVMWTRKS